MLRAFVKAVYDNHNYRFWFFQLVGWGGYSLLTFLSITLVDSNVSWPHITHIALQAVLGVLTTWPLRPLYRRTFNLSIASRLIIATAALLILSAVWTALRVLTFAWMAGESAIWYEFNYWYFGSVFVFLSWTVLYYGIMYFELMTQEHQKLLEESALKKEEHIRRVEAESLARNAQLEMLRYQLNPHFVFNTLNAIYALVRLNENDKAQEMIQLLSEFLRHSLQQGSVKNVTLRQELDSLMLYLNIEKARFEDRLTLEFEIEPQAQQALVPGLILQPIVENSMKYAIADSEDGGTVRVSARVQQEVLELEVSDTGPGMDVTHSGSGRGVGLRNTLARLEVIYGSKYTFETFTVAPSGLAVRVRFPFEAALPAQGEPGWQEGLIPCAS